MKRILIVILIVIVAAVGFVGWYLRPRQVPFLTDADTIRQAAGSASVREILWQPPTPLPQVSDAKADEFEPRVSADGSTMFFVRGRPGSNADIYASTRSPTGWTKPIRLDAINTKYDELGPEPSADGKSLYFYSDRPGGAGGYDLWMARLAEDGKWQSPTNLGSAVNSPYNEYSPALSPDGKMLCFSSNRPSHGDAPRPDAWRATVREDLYRNDYDLYVARITDAGVQAPVALAILNSSSNEGTPAFSPIADFLYFSSDRPGGQGGFDLYRSRIVRGEFTAPVNLGAGVNTAAHELDPALDTAGFELHFSSDRLIGMQTENNTPRRYHIYRTSSREVFRDVEVRQASIDWASLWRRVGPNLMWSLMALLAMLLLVALLRDARRRQLSLLARCLVASLLIHALLMLLFNVVQVSTAVAAAVHRSGPLQIALSGSGRGRDISSQIRGHLTQIALPAPASPRLPRHVDRAPVPAPVILAKFDVTASKIDLPTKSAIEIRPVEAMPKRSERDTAMPRIDIAPAAMAESFDLPGETAPIKTGEADAGATRKIALARDEKATLRAPTTQPAMAINPIHLTPASDSPVTSGSIQNSLVKQIQALDSPAPVAAMGFTKGIARLGDIASAAPSTEIAIPDELADSKIRVAESSPARPSTEVTKIESSEHVSTTPVSTIPAIVAIRPSVGSSINGSTMNLGDAAISTTSQPTDVAVSGLGGTAPMIPGGILNDATSPTLTISLPTETEPLAIAGNPETKLGTGGETGDGEGVGKGSRVGHGSGWEIGGGLGPQAKTGSGESQESGPVNLPVVGRIRGRVTDDETGEPLAGATVRLDLAEDSSIVVTTNSKGNYLFSVPQLPHFFAMSASMSGFLPLAKNVSFDSIVGRTKRVNFSLRRSSGDVVAIEDSPVVHHLGNDLFEGQINSQFQRGTEGVSFRAEFTLGPEQSPPTISAAEVELLAKGVQCPAKVRINGQLLDERMPESPADGSFGRYVLPVDLVLLHEGTNTIAIRTVNCRGDLDDFEFVNLQIRLHSHHGRPNP